MWASREASALVQGRAREGSNQVRAMVREELSAGAILELLALPVVRGQKMLSDLLRQQASSRAEARQTASHLDPIFCNLEGLGTNQSVSCEIGLSFF